MVHKHFIKNTVIFTAMLLIVGVIGICCAAT